eukprot:Nk52_evm24s914 gene=Nk52_evmTU24s914
MTSSYKANTLRAANLSFQNMLNNNPTLVSTTTAPDNIYSGFPTGGRQVQKQQQAATETNGSYGIENINLNKGAGSIPGNAIYAGNTAALNHSGSNTSEVKTEIINLCQTLTTAIWMERDLNVFSQLVAEDCSYFDDISGAGEHLLRNSELMRIRILNEIENDMPTPAGCVMVSPIVKVTSPESAFIVYSLIVTFKPRPLVALCLLWMIQRIGICKKSKSMENRGEALKALLTWVSNFDFLSVPHSTVEDLSDGVALFEFMGSFAPGFFDPNKIKRGVSDNWRLKVNNLKKLYDGLLEYYEEELFQSTDGFDVPDLNSLGQDNNSDEMLKLLEMIIGTAVFCDKKEDFIGQIMTLEQTTQVALMSIIKGIMSKSRRVSTGGDELAHYDAPGVSGEDVEKMTEELRALSVEKDDISRQYESLNREHQTMKLKYENLISENEDVKTQLRRLENKAQDSNSNDSAQQSLKAEVERLKLEIEESENSRLDSETRVKQLEQTVLELKKEADMLSRQANEARGLKDEIDILRHKAEKASKYESAIESYKKRLEEFAEIKRQMKVLEEQNNTYLQKNLDQEEELRKTSGYRTQIDNYKQKISGLESENLEAVAKVNRAEFEAKKAQETAERASSEKERLEIKIADLEEKLDEFEHSGALPGMGESIGGSLGGIGESSNILREKIQRLERENRKLAASGGGPADESERNLLLEGMLEDVSSTKAKLEKELLDSKQKVVTLESDVEDLTTKLQKIEASQLSESVKAGSSAIAIEQLAEAERNARDLKANNENLTRELKEVTRNLGTAQQVLEETQKELITLKKDQSLVSLDKQALIDEIRSEAQKEMEGERQKLAEELEASKAKMAKVDPQGGGSEKMKAQLEQINELLVEKNELITKNTKLEGYLNRSKQIIVSLQQKAKENSTLTSGDDNYNEAVTALRNQNRELQEELQFMKREREEAKEAHKREEKLIISAWYELGLQFHRKASTDRYASNQNGRSWLGRQRQKLGGSTPK